MSVGMYALVVEVANAVEELDGFAGGIERCFHRLMVRALVTASDGLMPQGVIHCL